MSKIHSTNGLERVNAEVKRRTDVVGIFPDEDSIVRLVGAILLEQNDEWAVQRARYMTLETMATLSHDPVVGATVVTLMLAPLLTPLPRFAAADAAKVIGLALATGSLWWGASMAGLMWATMRLTRRASRFS